MKESIFNSYSMPLLHLKTYIINDQVIKDRGNELGEGSNINYKIENFDNIAIQSGEKLDIYCDSSSKSTIMYHIGSVEGPLSKAWDEGLISINSI